MIRETTAFEAPFRYPSKYCSPFNGVHKQTDIELCLHATSPSSSFQPHQNSGRFSHIKLTRASLLLTLSIILLRNCLCRVLWWLNSPRSTSCDAISAIIKWQPSFSFDAPSSKAVVIRISSGKVAVFDQATLAVAASKGDILIIAH